MAGYDCRSSYLQMKTTGDKLRIPDHAREGVNAAVRYFVPRLSRPFGCDPEMRADLSPMLQITAPGNTMKIEDVILRR